MKPQDFNISKDKLKFHSTGTNLHDSKLQTKPVSYFKDAMYRFTKNKASILAAFIIMFLILFAIFAPLFTPYEVAYKDEYYKNLAPKSEFFSKLGFWDGQQEQTTNEQTYKMNLAIEQEIGRDVVVGDVKEIPYKDILGKDKIKYEYVVDTYFQVGCKFIIVNTKDYNVIQEF